MKNLLKFPSYSKLCLFTLVITPFFSESELYPLSMSAINSSILDFLAANFTSVKINMFLRNTDKQYCLNSVTKNKKIIKPILLNQRL